MKKFLLLLLMIGAAIIAATYAYDRLSTPNVSFPYKQEFKPLAVKRDRIIESINATGFLQPQDVAVVGSDLSGRVVEIYPQAGLNKQVKKDDPLLKLDDQMALLKLEQATDAVRLAEANIGMAEGNCDAAEISVKKFKDLIKGNVGYQRDLDLAEANLKTARNGLKIAKVRKDEAETARKLAQFGVDMTIIRSPIDGTIIEKKVVVGQAVSPLSTTPLFSIAGSLQKMEAQAQVAEGDIGKVQTGLKATFSLNVFADDADRFEGTTKRFSGKVAQIRPVPSNVQGAVYYTVAIDVDNERDERTKQWLLRPGMSVSVDIIRREHETSWLIPAEAIDFKLDEHYQTPEARAKREAWEKKLREPDVRKDWKRVWILDEEDKPWPVYVRVGSKGEVRSREGEAGNGNGAPGVEYYEVIEWEPDEPKLQRRLDPSKPTNFPEVITDAPAVQKRSLFEAPKIPKLF